jgi:hypothetical protein
MARRPAIGWDGEEQRGVQAKRQRQRQRQTVDFFRVTGDTVHPASAILSAARAFR